MQHCGTRYGTRYGTLGPVMIAGPLRGIAVPQRFPQLLAPVLTVRHISARLHACMRCSGHLRLFLHRRVDPFLSARPFSCHGPPVSVRVVFLCPSVPLSPTEVSARGRPFSTAS